MTEAGSGVSLVLAGDVMLGRGIDQLMAHPGSPELHEGFMRSALGYIELAERRCGPLPRQVPPEYVWGDALEAFAEPDADFRIVNLETAVTRSDNAERKGINYRMSPANVACLTAAQLDCCVLANNHVLDWGNEGLVETLHVLSGAGIAIAGAGRSREEAEAPAILEKPGKGRVLVFGMCLASSGVPLHWAAKEDQPGVWLLPDGTDATVAKLADRFSRHRRAGDVVVVSIHWGANWGYAISEHERRFAEALVEQAGVDVVHGHSSHHPKAIGLHRGRPVFFGCGDLINDYEGISGHESFRPDLSLLHKLRLGPDGSFMGLELLPFRIERFKLNRATREDMTWLEQRLDSECARFGIRISAAGGVLTAIPT